MRIGFLGDTHGDPAWVSKGLIQANSDGCDHVVQVGDFGIWPGDNGRTFENKVADLVETNKMPLYIVPGNHDCYDIIELLPVDPETGWLMWRPNVWVAPRGLVWTWGGVRFGALGGAVSVDSDRRVEGVSWWPQEAITYGQVQHLLDNAGARGVDILVVHDTPQGAHEWVTEEKSWENFIPQKLLVESRGNRQLVRAAVEGTHPHLVVGGHWHQLLDSTISVAATEDTVSHQTRVVNLAHDGTPGSYAWLDTKTRSLTIPL